jgi:ferrous-iron efflux pump FieF
MDGELTLPQRAKLLKRATYASISTALVLIVVKFLAWMMTGSVSMLASLVDSLMDSIASLINLLAIRYSLQPADREHRFGHGKAEPLAALVQAAFISGSAAFLVLHAFDRLRNPVALHAIDIGVGVMIFAMALTLLLLLFQRRVIKQTGSTAIQADAIHYASDLLGNLAIIAAFILSSFGWDRADPVFAIAVAIYIAYSALQVGSKAVHQLMDRELADDVQRQILDIAQQDPSVQGVHDLRTRQSGQDVFIQLHLELEDQLPLVQAHAIADRVERNIGTAIPGAEVIVHQDPVSVAGKRNGKKARLDIQGSS